MSVGLEQKKREDSIDLLRALAIVSVILFHYTVHFNNEYMMWNYTGHRFTYGYLGVELFFILSGYCIYLTITRVNSFSAFFAKRIVRLLPAFLFCMTVTFLFLSFFPLPDRPVYFFKYIFNFLFLSILSGRGFMDGSYWSLFVEVRFYILFGILYFLSKKNILRNWAMFTAVGLCTYFSVSLFSFLKLKTVASFADVLVAQVFIFPYALWFLVGVVIFEWKVLSVKQKICFLSPVMLYLVYLQNIEALFLLFIVLFSIIVIPLKTLSLPRWITWVGLISYPLYVVHQNFGVSLIRQLSAYGVYTRLVAVFFVLFAIASLVHVTIEERYKLVLYNKLYVYFYYIEKQIVHVFLLIK